MVGGCAGELGGCGGGWVGVGEEQLFVRAPVEDWGLEENSRSQLTSCLKSRIFFRRSHR